MPAAVQGAVGVQSRQAMGVQAALTAAEEATAAVLQMEARTTNGRPPVRGL